MAGQRMTLEQLLDALRDVRDDPTGGDAIIDRALGGTEGLAVAAAAEIVGRHRLVRHLPRLLVAWPRMVVRGEKRDPGCCGKASLIRTLEDLGHLDVELLDAACSLVQREPVWGGSVDTADEVRALAALAAVHLGHPEALERVAERLVDPSPKVRAAAATAAGDSGAHAGALMLRLLVRSATAERERDASARDGPAREAHPDVLAAAVSGLGHLDSRGVVDLARGLLASADAEVRSAVGLALAETRAPGALGVLIGWFEGAALGDERAASLVALAVLRDRAGWDRLVELIDDGPIDDAARAIAALGVFRGDATLAAAVRAAAAGRGLELSFDEHFGPV
jgi:HEAT repeat protein